MSDVKPCNDFRTARVGDSVYSYLHGWGTVSNIFPHADYGVNVKIDGSSESFTFKGYYETDNKNPTLFWGVPEIVSDVRPPARYWNLNGIAVFESPIKHYDEVTIGMYVAASSQECGYVKLSTWHSIVNSREFWVKHGMVYPDTDLGKSWAAIHGKAFLQCGHQI